MRSLSDRVDIHRLSGMRKTHVHTRVGCLTHAHAFVLSVRYITFFLLLQEERISGVHVICRETCS